MMRMTPLVWMVIIGSVIIGEILVVVARNIFPGLW